MLQDPHPVGKLRAAGWTIPSEVGDEYLLRVYDTRIRRDWLVSLAAEVGGGRDLPTVVVGGDFMTKPHVEDGVALHPTEFRRWGPAGDAPYRLVVPPDLIWQPGCSAVVPR